MNQSRDGVGIDDDGLRDAMTVVDDVRTRGGGQKRRVWVTLWERRSSSSSSRGFTFYVAAATRGHAQRLHHG